MVVRVFVWLAAAAVFTVGISWDAHAKKHVYPTPKGSHQAEVLSDSASQVWIVVNLFTGRTSKQAERVRDVFARLGAGGRGIVLPFGEITVENMTRLKPAFLVLSPNGMPWCKYRGKNGVDLENFFQALRVIVEEMDIPVMGICGGHQAMALAFGGKVGPIRGGEDDCLPYGKNPTERGRHDVHVVENDPLFSGMGKSLNLVQNHYDEVKKLPPGFINLASNPLCQYQIIRHATKPAYGVQAHTEYYYGSRPDGGFLLRNFLKIAGEHNRLAIRWKPSSPKESKRSVQEKPTLSETPLEEPSTGRP